MDVLEYMNKFDGLYFETSPLDLASRLYIDLYHPMIYSDQRCLQY